MQRVLMLLIPLAALIGCATGSPDEGFRRFRRDAEVPRDRGLQDIPDQVIDMRPTDGGVDADATEVDATEADAAPTDDADADGVLDTFDNCPDTPNPNQTDLDADGAGDACDTCPDFRDDGQSACPADLPPCVDLAEASWQWAPFAANAEPTTLDFVPGLNAQAVRARTEAAFEFYLQVEAPAGEALPGVSPDQVLRLAARGVNMNQPGWQGEFPEVRLIDGAGLRRILKPARPRLSVDGRWEIFAIPLRGDADWILQNEGADLADLQAVQIVADTWETGFELAIDALSFTRAGQICFNLPAGVFGE